jgi:hypothetical protein
MIEHTVTLNEGVSAEEHIINAIRLHQSKAEHDADTPLRTPG